MKNTISAVAILTFLLTVAVTSGRAPANATEGAETYKTKCVACHGSDGGGNTPMGQRMKVRDLRSSEVQKQTDDELSAIITNGKPPMPGYGKSLGVEKIRDLVAYLRSIATKG